uniref:Uncharacterized protein n=1 Tax=Glossina austeni TaxID=7395 RepID=A0A1A9V0N8_GLOAU
MTHWNLNIIFYGYDSLVMAFFTCAVLCTVRAFAHSLVLGNPPQHVVDVGGALPHLLLGWRGIELNDWAMQWPIWARFRPRDITVLSIMGGLTATSGRPQSIAASQGDTLPDARLLDIAVARRV